MRTPISAALRRLVAGAGVVVPPGFGHLPEPRLRSFATQYHQAPRGTRSSQEVYDGWKQFNLNCARCHGEDVLGTTIAPHLIMSLKPDGPINTKELFLQTVCAGRPAKGMPSWCALGMDPGTIEKIYALREGPQRREDGAGAAGTETRLGPERRDERNRKGSRHGPLLLFPLHCSDCYTMLRGGLCSRIGPPGRAKAGWTTLDSVRPMDTVSWLDGG